MHDALRCAVAWCELHGACRFETNYIPRLTSAALSSPHIDRDYYRCWQGLRSHFDPTCREVGTDGEPPAVNGFVSKQAAADENHAGQT